MEHTNPDDGDEPIGGDGADVGEAVGDDAGVDESSGVNDEPTDAEDAEDDPDVAADWMDPADDDILEAMRDEDVFTPDHVDELKICRGPYAATRCRKLAEYGLLEKLAIGMYDITDRGERYLAGDLDPSELEPEE